MTEKVFKILAYISFNIAAIFLILIFTELSLRFLAPYIKPQGTDKNLYMENRFKESHGLRPFSRGLSNGVMVKVDKYGFRENSTKIDTCKNSRLLLGDSVTMGIGVEADSTFAGILQNKKNDRNILNPSMIGYSINDYLNVFHYFVIEDKNSLKIDQVTMFWCLNDIYNDLDVITMPGGKIRSITGEFLNYVRVKTRTYYFIKTMIFDRPKTYYQHDAKLYTNSTNVETCIEKFNYLNTKCRERKINFEIVLLPYEYQLRKNISNNSFPQDFMENRINSIKIHSTNLTPYMKNLNIETKKIFLYGDGLHLSNHGHKLIADYLLKSL